MIDNDYVKHIVATKFVGMRTTSFSLLPLVSPVLTSDAIIIEDMIEDVLSALTVSRWTAKDGLKI